MHPFREHEFRFYDFCEIGRDKYVVFRSMMDPCIFVVFHPSCYRRLRPDIRNSIVTFGEMESLCDRFVIRGFFLPEEDCSRDVVMGEICARPLI